MTYIEIQQGMDKTAVSAGAIRVLRPFLPRTAQRLTRQNVARIFRNTRFVPRLIGALGHDLVARPLRAGGRGALWTLRYLTGDTAVAPGFRRVMRRTGNAASRLAALDLLASAVSPSWRETQFGWIGKGWDKLTDAGAAGVQKMVTALDTPSDVPIATTKYSPEALLSTFNPLSGVTGGKDYVPEQLVNAFQKVLPGHKGELAAHAATKIGATAVLAAGLVGAYRLARHVGDMGAIDSKGSAGKDMSSQLSTTFSGNLGDGEEEKKQKKAASEQYAPQPGDIMAPSNFSMQNLTGTALPLASMLLAAGLTYKGIDAAFDKIRNKRLDNAIAQKEQAVKNLITARAKLAKGELSDMAVQNAVAPIADKDIYTKAASQDKEAVVQEAVQLFGTLSAAVILASAIGSYAYTSAADENNIKYKAYKKALRTYAKNKSGMTPITVAPSDASSYFASIDAAKDQKPAIPRNMPSYDPDSLNKPISTSF